MDVRTLRLISVLVVFSLSYMFVSQGESQDLPEVRKERPRIFLREKPWDGPSLEKTRGWMRLPEYQERARKLWKEWMAQRKARAVTSGKKQGELVRKFPDIFALWKDLDQVVEEQTAAEPTAGADAS